MSQYYIIQSIWGAIWSSLTYERIFNIILRKYKKYTKIKCYILKFQ